MLEITLGKKTIGTDKPAFIMGIVNATPDSFFSGSRGDVELAKKLIAEGADIIDIGGESTRPGFTEVPADEEIDRIVPLIKAIRSFSDIPISVDTRKMSVMKAAFEAGADALNDVSALEDDDKMAEFAGKAGISVILMHQFKGLESERKTNPNITNEVSEYLEKRISYAVSQGINPDKIIVDPGIGFGKTPEENILLIKETHKLCNKKYPILMALSRKRCIGTMTDQPVEKRMVGTVAADMYSVMKGAVMIRVHDVEAARDSLNVMKYLF